ncbi:exosome complex exonuclease DIS3/RRP44 [Nematocida homosporus]|uniref:exosome complex exonuclease DIS3/RRP44 n=1 Tax=Nematocida homosporus TaxID=1912981 RepID=UPI00221FA60D|nr:exosome complex exonuclease DIS3/RRP44 [Nematocida homosporus]KAI5185807.1 exosome complex exonuclease DIS3/RRP44 [Nematocida homosporus]
MDRLVSASYKLSRSGRVQRVPNEVYLQKEFLCGFSCCGKGLVGLRKGITCGKGEFWVPNERFLSDWVPWLEEGEFIPLLISRQVLESLQVKYPSVYRRVNRVIDRRNWPVVEDRNAQVVQEFIQNLPDDTEYTDGLSQWYSQHIPSYVFRPIHTLVQATCGNKECNLVVEACETECKDTMGEVGGVSGVDGVSEVDEWLETGIVSVQYKDGPGRVQCGVEGLQRDINIAYEQMGRALDGDQIVVGTVTQASASEGRVVSIDKRARKVLAGTVLQVLDNHHLLIQPLNEAIPVFQVCCPSTTGLSKQLVLAWIEAWPTTSKYPIGRLIKAVGPEGLIKSETQALLAANCILDQDFEEEALQELPAQTWTVSDQDLVGREDLRHLPIASIDPPGCTDIDDALHAQVLPNGQIEIGVHIADVGHFVPANSALDREGRIRGCTVYLPNRRIDMLPPLLGTDLCSLHQDKDRLTFSVIWTVSLTNNQLQILDTQFKKTVIKSKASFTYSQAAQILKDGTCPSQATRLTPALTESLRLLKEVSHHLRTRRHQNGALVIHSSDSRISIPRPTEGQPQSILQLSDLAQNPSQFIQVEEKYAPEYDTHFLVEEFMLLANQCVAEKISSAYPKESLIRYHPLPAKEAFHELEEALQHLVPTITLDPQHPKALMTAFDQFTSNPQLAAIIGAWAARCMTQALYAPSSVTNKTHYGLAMDNYTHFTSPIRRYADVIVHRTLHNLMQNQEAPLTQHVLEETCQSINRSYRCAKYAARDATTLFSRELIPSTLQTLFILSISPTRVLLYHPEYAISGHLQIEPTFQISHNQLRIPGHTQSFHPLSPIQVILSPHHPRSITFTLP